METFTMKVVADGVATAKAGLEASDAIKDEQEREPCS
jgi:hypothetical protein